MAENNNSLGGKRKAALRFIFVTVLIDFLGIGIIAPMYAFYVMRFSTSTMMIGLLATSYSVMQFFAAPVLGALSDRFGRRPVLLIAQFGAVIGYLAFGLSNHLWLLFVSRMIAGVTGGSLSTAQAYIADVTTLQERSKGFAMFGLAVGIGGVLGPVISGLTVHWGLGVPSFVAAALALLNFIYGLFVLPESHHSQNRMSRGYINPLAPLGKYLVKPRFNLVALGILMLNLCFMTMQTIMSVFAVDRMGYGPAEVAYIMTYLGILYVLYQTFMVKYIMRLSERWLGIVCFGLISLGYLGIAFSHQLWVLLASLFILIFGNSGIQPCLMGRLSRLVPPTEQGQAMGASQSMTSLANIVGPLIAGWLYQATGQSGPWLGAAIYAAVGLVLYSLSFRPAKASQVTDDVATLSGK